MSDSKALASAIERLEAAAKWLDGGRMVVSVADLRTVLDAIKELTKEKKHEHGT